MAESDQPRPNVLLVVLDAARRDALAPYGAAAAATPAIAGLARRGHALPHAYATSSWTLPSHASMFAGALPRALGLSQPPDGTPQSARAVLSGLAHRFLPARLGAAGYECHGFSANLWASGHAGFDTGFDDFAYLPSERVERNNLLLQGGRRAQLAWAAEGLRSRSDDGAAAMGRALSDSISRTSPDRPAFWFVNLIECHSPYLPPRPWNDLGAAERVRAAIDAQRYMGFESICLQAAGRSTVPPESMARMRHLYARSIAYMDAWLADVLGALDRRGILDETLVIVTADHGESFGEDGFVAHGFSLGEQLINVPLVMAGPGARAVDGVFSLAELPAFIAGATGIDPAPWPAADLPDGVAVAQYDPMAPADDPRIVDFAARFGIGADGIRRLTTGVTCTVDGAYKLVRDDDGAPDRFYDLVADPGEGAPVADPPLDALARLRRAIEEETDRVETPGAGTPQTASPEEVAQLEQQMKLLGYM